MKNALRINATVYMAIITQRSSSSSMQAVLLHIALCYTTLGKGKGRGRGKGKKEMRIFLLLLSYLYYYEPHLTSRSSLTSAPPLYRINVYIDR